MKDEKKKISDRYFLKLGYYEINIDWIREKTES